MVLEKNTTLYERDEKGELIPIEVKVEIDENDERQLEYKGQTIFLIPMVRGQIRKMFSTLNAKDDPTDDKDEDGEIILNHVKKPTYSEKEIPCIKPALTTILVNTVLRESGLRVGNKSKVSAMKKKEDEFGKN